MRLIIPVLLCAGLAQAGEFAVLASGGRLHIDRHQTEGSQITLFTSSGTIEMQADQVRGFEAEDAVAQVAPKASPDPSSSAPSQVPASPQQMADRAAAKYGLPRGLVRSVMKAESGFQPKAVSPKGAIGLMQLMPATAQNLGANAQDPEQNVDAGTRYLRDLLEKYNGALWHALAAYNAGPGAVDKYQGVPPYPETLDYVRRVEREWSRTNSGKGMD